MEDPKSTEQDGHFLDAFDEFPFYDCPDSFESSSVDASSSSLPPQSTISLSSFPNSTDFQSPSSGGLRHRRSAERYHKSDPFLNHVESESFIDSVNEVKDKNNNNHSQYVSHFLEVKNESVIPASTRASTETNEVKNEGVKLDSDRAEVVSGSAIRSTNGERESDDGQFNFLVFLAELLVKAIGFQFHLLISFITFPMWALYYSCMFAVNPFRVLKRFRNCLIQKLKRLRDGVWNTVTPIVRQWLKEHKALLKFALRCGWGLFWSAFVCCVLVTLLISAFVISGVLMRYYLIEEPFELKQGLNFDYTKSKPVAFVPITSCPTGEWGEKNGDIGDGGGGGIRVIPAKQKLQAAVSLTLPESDYNRHLGIFQIRVEFLSERGKTLASLSHPGMLEFRSKPIRLLSTFFKIIPLVTGYVSEAQALDLQFRGYREGYIPTACIKVTIEQRAEFRAGAGIPEVYDAYLFLESELPFLKRMLWYWRRTLFVWLSMVIFVVELLFSIVCCRPVVIPTGRGGSNSAGNSDQRSHSVRR